MTIQEIIDRVDYLSPNQYSDEQKTRWLSDLDGRIVHEVFLTHEPRWGVMRMFEGYTDTENDLLLDGPYASDVYENYLLSRIAERNAEISKYNLYATLFNEAYTNYVNWYNRTHKATQQSGWRF